MFAQNIRTEHEHKNLFECRVGINYYAIQVIRNDNLKRSLNFGDIGSFGNFGTGEFQLQIVKFCNFFRRYCADDIEPLPVILLIKTF
jgi:hypothetical protein